MTKKNLKHICCLFMACWVLDIQNLSCFRWFIFLFPMTTTNFIILPTFLVLNATKGQLISECLFDFLNFPKNTEKFDTFLPKNMKGVEIIKIKTMPFTTTIYRWLYGLLIVFKDNFLWSDHFLDPWAEICQIFRCFLENLKNQKDILKLSDL